MGNVAPALTRKENSGNNNVATQNLVLDSKTDITGAGGPGKEAVTTAKTGAYCLITMTYYNEGSCTTIWNGFVTKNM